MKTVFSEYKEIKKNIMNINWLSTRIETGINEKDFELMNDYIQDLETELSFLKARNKFLLDRKEHLETKRTDKNV